MQKNALSCIFPRVPYCEALKLAQIESIRGHQNHLTKKLFQSVVNDPSNKLYALLLTRCNVGCNLRRERRFAQPLFRTKRFADSFVNRCVLEERVFILNIKDLRGLHSCYCKIGVVFSVNTFPSLFC